MAALTIHLDLEKGFYLLTIQLMLSKLSVNGKDLEVDSVSDCENIVDKSQPFQISPSNVELLL